MHAVSVDDLIQDLAVLHKRITGKTTHYDNTVATLQSMPSDAFVSFDVSNRIRMLARTAPSCVRAEICARLGVKNECQVRYDNATAGYLLTIATVLYTTPCASSSRINEGSSSTAARSTTR